MKKSKGEKNMFSFGRCFILGDSYSTFKGFIPEGYATWYSEKQKPETDVVSVEQTWWYDLTGKHGATLVRNCSYSGTTICHTGYDGEDYKEISFLGRMENLLNEGFFEENPVDTIFIFGGTNDSWAQSPVGELCTQDWTEESLYSVLPAFCKLLDLITTRLPGVRVICPINTELDPAISSGLLAGCAWYGALAVILWDIGKTAGHPNKMGMRQIRDQIIQTVENIGF